MAGPLPHDQRGSGEPVVLLHAGVGDRSMWSDHLEPLAAAGYRVIAPDLPGFGEATEELIPWDAVLDTMDALDVEQAVLVGNSWGGGVALRVAVLAPERVSRLVLVSARPLDAEPSPQLAAAWEAEEAAIERGDVDSAVAAVVEAWTLPDASATLRERIAAMQRRALEIQMAADEDPETSDPLDENPLPALNVPTLVVVGEHDMPDFHQAAALLAAALPDVRHTVIDGAGHLAPLEQPEAFRAALLSFLTA